MLRFVRLCLTVCLAHVLSSKTVSIGLCGYYKTLIGNPMLEVEPIGQRGGTATQKWNNR